MQELSPWPSWLADKKMASQEGEALICEVHEWGWVTQLAPWAEAHCLQTPLGRGCSALGRGMSFLPRRLGTHPLEGKEGQLDYFLPMLPMEKLRLRCSVRGHTVRRARTQALP